MCRLHREQRAALQARQPRTAVKKAQLKHDRDRSQLRAAAADQARAGGRGPARGENVVYDEYPIAGLERVRVHLDPAGALLLVIRLRIPPPGTLIPPSDP